MKNLILFTILFSFSLVGIYEIGIHSKNTINSLEETLTGGGVGSCDMIIADSFKNINNVQLIAGGGIGNCDEPTKVIDGSTGGGVGDCDFV